MKKRVFNTILISLLSIAIVGAATFNNQLVILAAEATTQQTSLSEELATTDDSRLDTSSISSDSTSMITETSSTDNQEQNESTTSSELPSIELEKSSIARAAVQDVDNWVDFLHALSDTNVSIINITKSFAVLDNTAISGITTTLGGNASGGAAYTYMVKANIARFVLIRGNNHTIDFGAVCLCFNDATMGNGMGWNITWQNLNVFHGNYYGFTTFNDLSTGAAGNQAKSKVTFDNVTNVGNQMIHSPWSTVAISGTTSNQQATTYTSEFRTWSINATNQTNMYISNLTVKENATFTVSSINAGNIELGSTVAGNLVLEKNATLNAVAGGTAHNSGEAYGTNLYVTQGNVILNDGAKLNLTPQANSSAITLYSSGSNITIGQQAQININSTGHTNSLNGYSYNPIWMGAGTSLTVNPGGVLDVKATGMGASAANIIHVNGNANFTVQKQGVFNVVSDSTSQSQFLLYFGSNGSTFQFADAQRVNLQRTATLSGTGTNNGLISIAGNGGELSVDVQKVNLWARDNFTETPTASWTPMYEMLLTYNTYTPTITTAFSITQENVDSFKSAFSTKNAQRVLYEYVPDVTVRFKTQAVDLPTDPYARLVQGSTNPGAFVRIVDTPINGTVSPALIPSDHKIASPVTVMEQPSYLTDNYTVKADAAGNFTFLISGALYRGFSAGSTVELFSFLGGKYDVATQQVLDTTPPTGQPKEHHALKGSAVPEPKEFVQNPTDTNPVPQTFTYAYSAENSVAEIAPMLNVAGEYNINVDLFDNAGNKTTISSTLVVHEKANEVHGNDIELETDNLQTMDSQQLEEYILTNSHASAQTIVDGLFTDLTAEIKVTDFGGLTSASGAGQYQVTLTVKKEASGLAADMNKIITVNVISQFTTLTLNFVNEVGTVVYSESLEKTSGELVDLTKEPVIVERLTFLTEKKYHLLQRPENESNYTVPLTEATLEYTFTGTLFIESVPTAINFGRSKVSIFNTKVEQATFDLPFVLGDNRATQNDWTLTATIQSPLTHQEDPSKTLPGALKYKVSPTNTITLSEQAQPIAGFGYETVEAAKSPTDSGTTLYNVSNAWSAGNSGFQLEVAAGSIRQLGEYQATILWQISNTP